MTLSRAGARRAIAILASGFCVSVRARAADIVLLGGDSIRNASPSQGGAALAAAGAAWEKPIFRRVSARLELWPALVVRERDHPIATGLPGRRGAWASAACLMGKVALLDGPTRVGLEAGVGPLYAWVHPIPPGGTRGNFFDQIGFSAARGRWSGYLRYVHVSNLDLAGRQRDPGFSFLAAGVGFTVP